MALANLITLARAKDNIPTSLGASDAQINDMIAAISDAIRKYCNRDFVSQDYDELYNGTGDRRLLLRMYPLTKVTSVRYRPVVVLKITNSLAHTPIARLEVLSTGLRLTRVTSGVTTTDTSITFAGNVTVDAVRLAVNALGSGWSAADMGYGDWPSADIYCPNGIAGSAGPLPVSAGALTTAGQFAELRLHTYELAGYQLDQRRGWLLRAVPYTDPELLHPEDLVWPVGINNFRVQYTAGYATVPEAVQEACAGWTAIMVNQLFRDPNLSNLLATTGMAQSWVNLAGRPNEPPDRIASLLAPYRATRVFNNMG